jgi:hypothetical protein
MEPTPEDTAKFRRALDGMTRAQLFEVIQKGMVNFAYKHAGLPIKELRTDVDGHNATLAELLRRVAALEAKHGQS